MRQHVRKWVWPVGMSIGLSLAACSGNDAVDGETESASEPAAVDSTSQSDETAWPSASGSTEAGARLRSIGDEISANLEVARQSDSWIDWESVGRLRLEKARLSGRLDAYAGADDALQRAFELAPGESGPHLTAARLDFTLHRFDRAADHLAVLEDNPLLGTGERATLLRMQGALALQRSEHATALAKFEESHALKPTTSSAARLAMYAFKSGQPDRADQRLAAAIEAHPNASDQTIAWLRLQRGVIDLESGRYDEAHRHFESANATFTGWYMIEEHLAEVEALIGQTQASIARYRGILERAPKPEFMDALAGVLEAEGQTTDAERLRERARGAFDDNIERFPNASYGHALGFFLANGPTHRALELARKNYDVRPSATATIALAQAEFMTGDTTGARERIDAVAETRWKTAPLHATAAIIFEHDGLDERAARQRRLARERNPKVFDSFDWLVPPA